MGMFVAIVCYSWMLCWPAVTAFSTPSPRAFLATAGNQRRSTFRTILVAKSPTDDGDGDGGSPEKYPTNSDTYNESGEEGADIYDVASTLSSLLIPPKILPQKLQNYPNRTFRQLSYFFSGYPLDIYIIGTAHVSKDSATDVQLLLESVGPDIIFVELCQERLPGLLFPNLLTENNSTDEREAKSRDDRKDKSQRASDSYSWAEYKVLKSIQESDEAISETGIIGQEFLTAIQYWNETVAVKRSNTTTTKEVWPRLMLGDRPMSLTVARYRERMTKRDKLKHMLDIVLPLEAIKLLMIPATAILLSLALTRPAFTPMIKRCADWIGVLVSWGIGAKLMLGTPSAGIDNEIRSILYSESDEDYHKFMKENGLGVVGEEVIGRERDIYMGCQLYNSCCSLPVTINKPKRFAVVAIVGLAHVAGVYEVLTDLMRGSNSTAELMSPLLRSKKWNAKFLDLATYVPSVPWSDWWLQNQFKKRDFV